MLGRAVNLSGVKTAIQEGEVVSRMAISETTQILKLGGYCRSGRFDYAVIRNS